MMLFTNRVLAGLLLISVFLNIGFGSVYFKKRLASEKTHGLQ